MGRRRWWQDEQRPYEDEAVVWTTPWLEVASDTSMLAAIGAFWYVWSRWALAAFLLWLFWRGAVDEGPPLRRAVARRLGIQERRRLPARPRRAVRLTKDALLLVVFGAGFALVVGLDGVRSVAAGVAAIAVVCVVAVATWTVRAAAGVDAPPEAPPAVPDAIAAMRRLRRRPRAQRV